MLQTLIDIAVGWVLLSIGKEFVNVYRRWLIPEVKKRVRSRRWFLWVVNVPETYTEDGYMTFFIREVKAKGGAAMPFGTRITPPHLSKDKRLGNETLDVSIRFRESHGFEAAELYCYCGGESEESCKALAQSLMYAAEHS